MKYKINDEVTEIASGNRCLIVATKESPWKNPANPYNLKEIFPEKGKDYLVLVKRSNNEYNGQMHLFEHQIRK